MYSFFMVEIYCKEEEGESEERVRDKRETQLHDFIG